MSEAKITKFFRAKKNQENPTIAANTQTTDAEKFYRNCLQQKKCDEISCLNLKKELSAQLAELNNKIRYHEEAVNTCKIIINDKEIEINHLEITAASNEIEKDTQQEKLSTAENDPIPMRFAEFSKYFTTNQLAELRSIGMSSREDSSFVMTAMKYIYADNLESLKSKSVTGRCNKKDQMKTKISPEKNTIIRNIFERRMSDIITDDKKDREKKINKFMKDAITNITKNVERKEQEKRVERRLQFND